MRLIIQRVRKASVKIIETGKTVGQIDKGLLILVGVGDKDTLKDAETLAEKTSKLRILADEKSKMNLSVVDKKESILAVSQFTLYADTSQGNRPSFIKAANPKLAQKIYHHFVSELKNRKIKTEIGSFGNYMEIESELDGPVTIVLESERL